VSALFAFCAKASKLDCRHSKNKASRQGWPYFLKLTAERASFGRQKPLLARTAHGRYPVSLSPFDHKKRAGTFVPALGF
jgi:hypothetical protein